MSNPFPNSGFLDFVYNYYKGLKDIEITLAYEGDINHQIMKAFTDLIEDNMSQINEPEALRVKVYHIMVEGLQNISKHAVHPGDLASLNYTRGVFLVCRSENVYNVVTGNVIRKDRNAFLKELISHVNSLTKKQLDELYKKQLREGHISEEGGAGLGFIDIRRKTGNDLKYEFLTISDTHDFFLFTSTIPRNI
jgi:hypothetical protein